MEENKKIGSVLIVGGGIAGIQASLDLANSGYKVYLLEKAPAIGGGMAQLDKTFPTNDCAMCIMAPKLVECGRHHNIELITNAELEEVIGDGGNFTIAIRKKPRYVDLDKCTGCGLCVENCPVTNQIYEIYEEPVQLDKENLNKIKEIISEYRDEKGNLMPILQKINSEYNYLPGDLLRYIAQELKIPLSTIFRIATFYNAFSFTPRGRFIISVCLGTACYVKGGEELLHKLEEEIGITKGQTTEDLKFSLEGVGCLGCCSLAPVIKINEETYGRVKVKDIPKILAEYD